MKRWVLTIVVIIILSIASYIAYTDYIGPEPQKRELLRNLGILLSYYNLDPDGLLNGGKAERVSFDVEDVQFGIISPTTTYGVTSLDTCNKEFSVRKYPLLESTNHGNYNCRIESVWYVDEKYVSVRCECFYLKA